MVTEQVGFVTTKAIARESRQHGKTGVLFLDPGAISRPSRFGHRSTGGI
jgi:hypothetical protein